MYMYVCIILWGELSGRKCPTQNGRRNCPGKLSGREVSGGNCPGVLPYTRVHSFIQFIQSGHFYSAPSTPLPLRGAPDYSTDTVSEFHAEAHRQLKVKDLPKVPTWRPERESNARPSG